MDGDVCRPSWFLKTYLRLGKYVKMGENGVFLEPMFLYVKVWISKKVVLIDSAGIIIYSKQNQLLLLNLIFFSEKNSAILGS